MSPFHSRKVIAAGLGGALLLIILVVGGLYLAVIGGSAPAKLAISAKSPLASASASLSPAQTSASWVVANGSVAGYRVHEQLAFVAAPSDAVGRTSSVTGGITLAHAAGTYTVTAASFSVDVSSLASDRSMRDRRIHVMGLESDQYPTATFKLLDPIVLPAAAADGQVVHVLAHGELTIHGTTRPVTIPMDARLAGSQIDLAGSLTFPFSDFNMVAPSIGGFVSVQDNATMEFHLLLQRG